MTRVPSGKSGHSSKGYAGWAAGKGETEPVAQTDPPLLHAMPCTAYLHLQAIGRAPTGLPVVPPAL